MKKIICILLAMAMSLSLFGCSGKTASDGEVTGGSEPETEAKATVDKSGLEALVSEAEGMDTSAYLNGDYLKKSIESAKAVMENENATETEVNAAMETVNSVIGNLNDGTKFPDPADLKAISDIPDPFTFLDGSFVDTPEEWAGRAAELSAMYQHYMYGVWRDGSDEELSYEYADGSLTIKIKRISTGAETSFKATVMLPDESISAPEGGYPVIVGMHQGISEDTANKNGYATITLDFFGYPVASDDTKHQGAFYELYPYGDDPAEQTGVLMAWGWGCSKIIDALEAGLGEELNISPENTIVTGVSRWGKAAAVCGAFEKRFKMVAPSCSGAGGLALYRYTSEGKTYDFSSKGVPSDYKYGQNEPIGSLQSSAERGWFNDMFLKFKDPEKLPMDQHMLAGLVADDSRYMFIIGSCIYEDWVNAPAMWYSYLGAKEIFRSLGIEDHIAINIHKEGHAVIPEDIEYMTDYFDYHVYGKEPDHKLEDLNTSVFALEQNVDKSMDGFTDWWMAP